MPYQRVLPRDLFNEAKLLKCLGRLSLLIEDGMLPMRVIHDTMTDPGFLVDQNPDDGSFFCANLQFYAPRQGRLRLVPFHSALNSRESWPLLCTWQQEELAVFNEDGSLTDEFRQHVLGPACEWPGCTNPGLCRSGNAGGALVCEDHFGITNGKAAEELTAEERQVILQLIEKHEGSS